MNLLKKYICELVLVINLFLISPMHDFKIWWNRPVINDAFGYYAYLPAVFIYHDLNYNFMAPMMKKHYQDIVKISDPKGAFIVKFKNHEVNKYPPGVAYYQAPFFFLAHAYASLTGLEADGYSTCYMVFLCIGAVFWQYVFFKLLFKIFSFYSLSTTAFFLTVPLISFGTNVFFYTQMFGTYSHLYSLLSISVFFYGGIRFFNSDYSSSNTKYFFLLVFGYALTVVTRNINAISLLLLPCMGFRFNQLGNYLSFLKNKGALLSLIISFGVLFSMLLFWHLQTGYWLIDSYQGESFDWLHPKIFKSLFSAHKGWFFYTPLALLSLLGLFYMPRALKWNAILLLTLVIYINSSWSAWDYGTGFSLRAYIDWYIILALALGFLIERVIKQKLLFVCFLSGSLIFTSINLLFSVQFLRGIISGTSQGIEYTIKNFFRLRPLLEFMQSEKSIVKREKVINNFDTETPNQNALLNSEIRFSKGIQTTFPAFLKPEMAFKVRYGADITMNDLKNEVLLCASVVNEKDSILFWQQTNIMFFPLINKPERVETGFNFPKGLPPNALLKVFFWEPEGDTKCYVDNMYVEFLEVTGD